MNFPSNFTFDEILKFRPNLPICELESWIEQHVEQEVGRVQVQADERIEYVQTQADKRFAEVYKQLFSLLTALEAVQLRTSTRQNLEAVLRQQTIASGVIVDTAKMLQEYFDQARCELVLDRGRSYADNLKETLNELVATLPARH